MIGQKILDLVNAQIVMDEMTGAEYKHNSHKSFDMIIMNHSRKWLGMSIMIDIECLFHGNNSGGQLKIGNLNQQMKSFFQGIVPNLDLSFYDYPYGYTIYIESEADEQIALNFLMEIYEVAELAV